MATLPHRGFYALPRSCPVRGKPDRCITARDYFTRNTARIAGGFTEIPCRGAWLDQGRVERDTNVCYLVRAKSQARLSAVGLIFTEAVQMVQESAGFHERDRMAYVHARARGLQRRLP